MKEQKIAAAYVRVSTDDQTEYSPDSQLKLIKKYASDNNLIIEDDFIYRDEGISGTGTEKRTEFNRMMRDARNKKFNFILVYDYSRFARNKKDSVTKKEELKQNNVELVSITQTLPSGNERVILESVIEGYDEYYVLNLSKNVKRGKMEKASRGEWQGAAPYGYNYDRNFRNVIINKDEADIVKYIFELWNNNPYFKPIIKEMKLKNVKTKKGNDFCDRTLDRMLRNPIYISKNRYCEGGMKRNYTSDKIQLFDAKWESIIDEETFFKAQELMKIHDEKYKGFHKSPCINEYWLSGIIKCSSCGRSLVRNKSYSRAKAHFQCSGYNKLKCLESHYISEDKILEEIEKILNSVISGKFKIEISEKTLSNISLDYKLLKEQLKRIDVKEKRIKDAYLAEIDSLEEYKDNKHKIVLERKKIELELSKIDLKDMEKNKKEGVYKNCLSLANIINDDKIDKSIKHSIAHILFEEIIYNKKENSLEVYFK